MPLVDVAFARQEGRSAAPQSSRERLINMFAELEVNARSPLIIRQRPGLRRVLALAGEKRAIERHRAFHYVIAGATLYRFDGAALTTLGTLNTNSGRCSMVFNDNDEILISDGSTGYVYTGGTLSVLSAPEPVGHVAYISGYGVFQVPNSDRFYTTALNDFTSVDALDFATAESQPDRLVRVFSDHNQIWMMGEDNIEVWDLSGDSFPLARFTNAQIQRGLGAAFSVVSEDNSLFFLGDDMIVYRDEGYRPVAMSTPVVSRLIEDVPVNVRPLAHAFSYTSEGEKFYVLTFPDYLTLMFNIRTGAWSTCRTYGFDDWHVSGGESVRYLLTDGGIAVLDTSLSTDESGIMERGGVCVPITAGGSRLSIRSFFLDAEVGRADINTNARVMMRAARDGETFGNERWRSLGATGQYKRRPMWRNLGIGREISIEFLITDPVEFKVIGAKANVTAGAS